jgi:hypothetical protein
MKTSAQIKILKKGDKVSVIKECVIPGYTVTPKAKGTISFIHKGATETRAIVEFDICGLRVHGTINCNNLKKRD